MIKDIILRDTEIIKIKILKILISLPNHAISNKEVTKQTGVSQFRLQNLIEELDTEINQHITDANVSFEYDNNYLVAHNLTFSHVRLLRLEYIVNSNSFKILRYNQFENNQNVRRFLRMYQLILIISNMLSVVNWLVYFIHTMKISVIHFQKYQTRLIILLR